MTPGRISSFSHIISTPTWGLCDLSMLIFSMKLRERAADSVDFLKALALTTYDGSNDAFSRYMQHHCLPDVEAEIFLARALEMSPMRASNDRDFSYMISAQCNALFAIGGCKWLEKLIRHSDPSRLCRRIYFRTSLSLRPRSMHDWEHALVSMLSDQNFSDILRGWTAATYLLHFVSDNHVIPEWPEKVISHIMLHHRKLRRAIPGSIPGLDVSVLVQGSVPLLLLPWWAEWQRKNHLEHLMFLLSISDIVEMIDHRGATALAVACCRRFVKSNDELNFEPTQFTFRHAVVTLIRIGRELMYVVSSSGRLANLPHLGQVHQNYENGLPNANTAYS